MAEEEVKKEVKVVAHHPADTNGDGKVSEAEEAMYLEFKRKELEDADLAVVIASMAGLSEAQKTLGSMAPTYFVAVAGIVAAFFGAQAYSKKSK